MGVPDYANHDQKIISFIRDHDKRFLRILREIGTVGHQNSADNNEDANDGQWLRWLNVLPVNSRVGNALKTLINSKEEEVNSLVKEEEKKLAEKLLSRVEKSEDQQQHQQR